MNKYEKQYKKIEQKSRTKETIQNVFLILRVLKKWNKNYKNKLEFKNDLFFKIMFNLSEVPDEFAEWIKNNILPKLNTSSLIEMFLVNLSYQIFNEDKTTQKVYMNSMKKAGLVKEIVFDEENISYKIITNHDRKYSIRQASNDRERAENCAYCCHEFVENILRGIINNKSDIDISACCVLYYDLFNNPHYHSYLVRDIDDVVIDGAHNIKTSFEFYLKELNHNLLLKEEASKILVGIDTLKATDSEFAKSSKAGFLKYAMNNQIKGKR